MKSLKKILRIAGLICVIIIASTGVGLTGAFLPTNREPYLNKEIRIEMVDEKKEEDEDDDADKT